MSEPVRLDDVHPVYRKDRRNIVSRQAPKRKIVKGRKQAEENIQFIKYAHMHQVAIEVKLSRLSSGA
jgi:hypothetical protein